MSEGMIHRRVKEQIAQALQAAPGVTNVVLEQYYGSVRADMSFQLRGKRGAIELQLSDKPLALIDERTRRYHELGIHVLWVLHNAQETLCAGSRLVSSDWEEYLHALYFGVVYYWAGGQELQPVYLQRRQNLYRRYFDSEQGQWDSPLYKQIRTCWLLDQTRITDLLPVIRQAKQVGHYTLPAAHLWCLPRNTLKDAHEKQITYMDEWRWRVFTPPAQG
jgi:hypothetical protein